MKNWFAIIEEKSGRLESVATEAAPPDVLAARGLVALEMGPQLPARNQMWDAATRGFVARPAKRLGNRVDDVMALPEMAKLSDEERAKMRAALDAHMSDAVYNADMQPGG